MFADMPDFSHINYPGYSISGAQNSYSSCIARGGSIDECGIVGAQAGFPTGVVFNGVTKSTTTKSASIADKTKCMLNAWTLKDFKACLVGSAKDAQNVSNNSWFGIDLGQVTTVIIGVVFIIAALFLLRPNIIQEAAS